MKHLEFIFAGFEILVVIAFFLFALFGVLFIASILCQLIGPVVFYPLAFIAIAYGLGYLFNAERYQ